MYCCYYSINVFIQNDGCSYVFWVGKKINTHTHNYFLQHIYCINFLQHLTKPGIGCFNTTLK